MQAHKIKYQREVHCRIGSLEIALVLSGDIDKVHCRIGSLERKLSQCFVDRIVHCRIGSLEISRI